MKIKMFRIEECRELYNHMLSVQSSERRAFYGKKIIEYYNNYCEVRQYIYINEKRRNWEDRIVFVMGKEDFDDGINYDAPKYKGLYFLGCTNFNPITNEKYYWVKIGKSKEIASRMKKYDTDSPMTYRIDFCQEYEREEYYHARLREICLHTCNHNKEWFLVDEKTYLEMCEKGFSYFN